MSEVLEQASIRRNESSSSLDSLKIDLVTLYTSLNEMELMTSDDLFSTTN